MKPLLNETRRFAPPIGFVKSANVSGMAHYQRLVQQAERDWHGFWRQHATNLIDWHKPFTEVHAGDAFHRPRWFGDGELNVSVNCLDRHLDERGDKVAIIYEKDTGETERITYRELYERVCQFANGLRRLGARRGDSVVIYLPMTPEAVVAMQACARIGAIHSVVFGGFSAKSLQDRIRDVRAKVVITASESVRGGKTFPLKAITDEALAGGCESVEHVIVYERTANKVELVTGRDMTWEAVVSGMPRECEPEVMNAEDVLFILYTSGSTGKPKGVQHSSAGYLLGAILTMNWVFDYKPHDVYWCTADVGWITGHTYVCYGPLAVGATQVIFEGVPTYPDASRFWEIAEKHRVTVFYTAPTAIRSLIKLSPDAPSRFDLSSLRLLGTVGEPINPEAWMWYHDVVGGARCPIVDTWWQTETGANMIAPLAGAMDTKPGSCSLPLPGVFADVVDEAGKSVGKNQGGLLVIKKPWPSQARSIWGDHARFLETYFPPSVAGGRYYVTNDSAYRDDDGYIWIMGRVDDVLNVSGHRIGTAEVESALVMHDRVAEAAVVGKADALTGQALFAFVVVNGEIPATEALRDALRRELSAFVAKEIGAIARLKHIKFGENLPKTRSGKIMRRLLRSIANGVAITDDTSTLENAAIIGTDSEEQFR